LEKNKQHAHHAHHHHHHSADENILTAFILNFVFVIIELVGGILTNSVAILSDAVHDLGDCAAIGCAYVLERISKRGADERYTYGYGRYSLVSALITALILVAGSALIIYSSVRRLIDPQEIRAEGMLIIAVLGVIVNGAAVLKTSHGTGANERVISLHMLEDVLGWVVVLVGSALIWIFEIPIIDPILSLAVAAFILVCAVGNIKSVLLVLLERAPEDFDTAAYAAELMSVENVLDVHHVHVWTLDGNEPMATLHAVVPEWMTSAQADTVRHSIEEKSESFGIDHLTVQLESCHLCGERECCPHEKCVREHCHHHHGHTHH